MLNCTSSFEDFSKHLRTNAVGPIITAQKLLQTRIPIRSITFMSSDSGSATDFRVFEDGYGLLQCGWPNNMSNNLISVLQPMQRPKRP